MKNELIRHALAAIDHRFSKTVMDHGTGFGDFKIGEECRTPNEIVNHMFDLVNRTSMKLREGHFNCPAPDVLNCEEEIIRFKQGVKDLDLLISKTDIDMSTKKKLLQGPLLDVTTHIGQLAMLNGLAGHKVKKKSYYTAHIDHLN